MFGFVLIGALLAVMLWLALREPGHDRDYK